MPMKMVGLLLVACVSAAAAPAAVAQPGVFAEQRRSQQEEVLKQRATGRILPLREIERRVVPSMRDAQYIGFDFDSETGIYTLKFLRKGKVIWVDVDGHSGQILRSTG